MDKEITIKNGETEITINEQAISVSAPNVSVTVMTDGESTSITTIAKDKIQSEVIERQMNRVGSPGFNC